MKRTRPGRTGARLRKRSCNSIPHLNSMGRTWTSIRKKCWTGKRVPLWASWSSGLVSPENRYVLCPVLPWWCPWYLSWRESKPLTDLQKCHSSLSRSGTCLIWSCLPLYFSMNPLMGGLCALLDILANLQTFIAPFQALYPDNLAWLLFCLRSLLYELWAKMVAIVIRILFFFHCSDLLF